MFNRSGRFLAALSVFTFISSTRVNSLSTAPSPVPAAVTLRYKFKPGLTLLYSFTETSSSTLSVGERPGVLENKQTSNGTDRKAIVSFENGQAVVEETTIKGTLERTDLRGSSTQVISPVVRRYTFTTIGRLLKTERKQPTGEVSADPQPLDGLTFSLPEKPVADGASWSEALNIIGLDGNPLVVKAVSTYKGSQTRQLHLSDQIDVTYSGAFKIAASNTNPEVEGSLSGKLTYYLARDLGQEVEIINEATITFKSSANIQGKVRPFVRTLKLATTKTLNK